MKKLRYIREYEVVNILKSGQSTRGVSTRVGTGGGVCMRVGISGGVCMRVGRITCRYNSSGGSLGRSPSVVSRNFSSSKPGRSASFSLFNWPPFGVNSPPKQSGYVYTGRPILVSTKEYYDKINMEPLDLSCIDQKAVMDLIQQSPKQRSGGFSPDIPEVNPGDVVECISREGGITFGLVVDCEKLTICSVDGNMLETSSRDIMFVLPGFFKPELVKSCFNMNTENLSDPQGPRAANDLSEKISRVTTDLPTSASSINSVNDYCIALRILIKSCHVLLPKLVPLFTAVYTQTCSSTSFNALPWQLVVSRALRFSRIHHTRLTSIYAELACHIHLTNDPVHWRYSKYHTKGNKWAMGLACTPSNSIDETNRILDMNDEDYQYFGALFKQEYSRKSNILDSQFFTSVLSTSDEKASASIIRFLNHYINYPHAQFKPVVSHLLSDFYPERSPGAWLTSPSSVYQLLCAAGKSNDEGRLESVFSDFITSHPASLDIVPPSKDIARDLRRPWHISVPVYMFLNGEGLGIGVSLEQSGHIWTLSFHVPDLTTILTPSSPLMPYALSTVKTVKIGDKILPIFPKGLKQHLMSWMENDKFSKQTPLPCLSFSVSFKPWDSSDWNTDDVHMTLTEISIESIQIVPETMENDTGEGFEDHEDRFSDLNPDMEGDPSLSSNHNVHKLMSSRFPMDSDLSRTSFNDVSLIQALLEKNFWKRMNSLALNEYPEDLSTGLSDSYSKVSFNPSLEVGVICGELCAIYANKYDIPLPYQRQHLLTSSSDMPTLRSLLSGRDQQSGRLADSLRFIASRYFSGIDTQTNHGPHFGLGLIRGYVGVADPLNNVYHLIAQWQLVTETLEYHAIKERNHLNDLKSDGLWDKLSASQLDTLTQSTLKPRETLTNEVKRVVNRYSVLRWLEQELRQTKGYFIFKCILVSDATFPEIALGYCVELGIHVDIAMKPYVSLKEGDQVVCTGILELEAVEGNLVLGL